MTKAATWENRIVGTGNEDPNQILANPFNFRKHPKHQQAAMTGVLNEIGWIQDVIINRVTGHLIDGHLRVELAMKKGESVPVKYVELTEHEEKIALASLDPIGALAEQDTMMLDQLVEDIGTVADEDLSEFLDSLLSDAPELDDEEEDGLTDDDEAPDAPVEPTVKAGDVWLLGRHRLICGDSTNMDDVERLMDGEKADMLWIDPPYNVAYEGSDGQTIDNDDMDNDSFRQFLRDLFTSCCTFMKEGAPFYIAHADSEGYNFRGAAVEAGLTVKQCLIWVKNSFVMGRQDYHWQHEPILYGWKEGAAHKWYGERNKKTVLEDAPSLKDLDRAALIEMVRDLRNTMSTSIVWEDKPKANSEHPTMKPVRLIVTQLKNSSRRGDIVIDLCGGSGSTLIACEKIGRSARLCELSPKYAEVIVKRWMDYTGEQAIHEETGLTFDEISRA